MPHNTVPATLLKNVSIRLSHEACLDVNTHSKRFGTAARKSRVSLKMRLEKIHPRHQGEVAMAHVLVVAADGAVLAGYRRTVRRARADRPDIGFFVVGDVRLPTVSPRLLGQPT